MAMYDESFLDYFSEDLWRSSSDLGLDLARPLGDRMPPSPDTSPYIDRPLPPIPPRKSSKRKAKIASSYLAVSSRRSPSIQAFGQNPYGSEIKESETAEQRFCFESHASETFQLANTFSKYKIEENGSSRKIASLAGIEKNGTLQDSTEPHLACPNSALSTSSASVYSDDPSYYQTGEILNDYNNWDSRPNARKSSKLQISPKLDSFYFHAGRHSASASELDSTSCYTKDVPSSQFISSAHHKKRADPDSERHANGSPYWRASMTLEKLIVEERHRYRSKTFAPHIRNQNPRKIAETDDEDTAPPRRDFRSHLMSSSTDASTETPSIEDYHQIIRALQLRPKPSQVQDRSISRFSDHSSSADSQHSSFGNLSHIRDSLISHVRSNSPFRGFTRSSQPLRERSAKAPVSVPSPLPASSKRKRNFSSVKHSLKIPFDFSTSRKRVNSVDSPSFKRRMPDVFKALPHIPATVPPTVSSSDARSISPPITAATTISSTHSGCTKPEVKYLSNYARRASGPSTPLPNLSHGFMTSFSTPSSSHLNRNELNSKPAQGVLRPKPNSWSVLTRASSTVPTKVSTTVSAKVSDAIGDLKEKGKAKISNISMKKRIEDEKRKEALMKTIVVIGENDQCPNGNLSQWI